MALADDIQAEFPAGVEMPSELRRLCDLDEESDDPVTGYLELRPQGLSLKGWFGDDTEAWRQLAGFGAGPDGSILAFWLYSGSNAATAPVVHLGSEGDHFLVLANDIREFLQLWGVGYSEVGFENLDEPPEKPDSTERLREWLAAELGIQCPTIGGDLFRKAQSRHPVFETWVRAAQEKTITRNVPELERLRQQTMQIAEQMYHDSCSKNSGPTTTSWDMWYKLVPQNGSLKVYFSDYGKWYPVSAESGLSEVAEVLLTHVRNRQRPEYELRVSGYGWVSIGPYCELAIAPPDDDSV